MLTRSNYVIALALAAFLLAGCKSPPTTNAQAEGPCPHCFEGDTGGSLVNKDDTKSTTSFVTEWLAPDDRGTPVAGFSFENQSGSSISFRELRGAPVAISFIYTRCENERKCPLVARTLGQLAMLLQKKPIHPSPALLLITYDPEFDTPSQLTEFALAHNFPATTPRAMLLRPDTQAKDRLFRHLKVRVNYNERGVNLHGIQLILLDKQGRYVRTYHSLLWENARVLSDLARLAAE